MTISSQARRPGFMQAAILLVTSGLTVLVTAILGPSLPMMQEHFKDVPSADYLVPLTLTIPMLMMAGFSVIAGALSDRMGRKWLLVGATALYAFVGTAPLYLDSIYTILASRAGLGILEATLMVVSTAMIGDYYDGDQRARYMALQTTVSASSAFLLNNLGGAIGEFGWRAPYSVYVISLVLAPLMVAFLWEPQRKSRALEDSADASSGDVQLRPFLIGLTCVLGVVTGIAFMVVPVHFGFLHGALGVQSPAQIGFAYGINSLGVIVGTLSFGWLIAGRLRVGWQVGLAFLIAGAGFVTMWVARDYNSLTAAGFLNGVGSGLLLPTMVTWNMRILPVKIRGLGTGAFQSSLFLGMFLSAIVVVWLEQQLGSRALGVASLGGALIGLAIVSLVAGLLAGSPNTADAASNAAPAEAG